MKTRNKIVLENEQDYRVSYKMISDEHLCPLLNPLISNEKSFSLVGMLGWPSNNFLFLFFLTSSAGSEKFLLLL